METERGVLGFTHQDVGEAVARRWNLPASLVDVLGRHDRFSAKERSLRNVVVMADHIANLYFAVLRSGSPRKLAEIERLAGIHLGIAPDRLAFLLGQLRADVDECLGIFGLDEARESKRVAKLGSAPGSDDPLQSVYVAMEADIHRKSAQLALLQQISRALVREGDPAHIVPMVLEGLYVSLHLARLVLVLRDGDGFRGATGFGDDVDGMLARIDEAAAAPKHPLRDVLGKGRPLRVLDRTMPVYAEALCGWEWPARSFAAVPIPTATGTAGALLGDRGDEPLTDDDLEMMALFANQMSLALAKG